MMKFICKVIATVLVFLISACSAGMQKQPTFQVTMTLTSSPMPSPIHDITPYPTATYDEGLSRSFNVCPGKIEAFVIPRPDERSFVDIARSIFELWLTKAKTCETYARIDDFRIDDVQQYTTTSPFLFGVYYHILPSYKYSLFFAGNGGFGPDGYYEKYNCFELVEEEDNYHLTGFWTMC